MFSLPTSTKAKIRNVEILSDKDRPADANPGAKLKLTVSLSNDVLTEFDGSLRAFLFTQAAGEGKAQKSLEGVKDVSDAPALTKIGEKVGTIAWHHEFTGYRTVFDLGLGRKESNIELEDCKLYQWRLTPKDGGTVVCQFSIDAPDVPEKSWGRLAKQKGREIEIQLHPPEVVQGELTTGDGKPAPARTGNESAPDPFGAGKKAEAGRKSEGAPPQSVTHEKPAKKDAGQAFAEAHGKAGAAVQ